MRFAILPLLAFFPGAVFAQPMLPPLSCDSAQNWHLDLFGSYARLRQYEAMTTEFNAGRPTAPAKQDWPKAIELTKGATHSVAILNEQNCALPGGTYPISLTFWDQSGPQTQLRLGCCTVVE